MHTHCASNISLVSLHSDYVRLGKWKISLFFPLLLKSNVRVRISRESKIMSSFHLNARAFLIFVGILMARKKGRIWIFETEIEMPMNCFFVVVVFATCIAYRYGFGDFFVCNLFENESYLKPLQRRLAKFRWATTMRWDAMRCDALHTFSLRPCATAPTTSNTYGHAAYIHTRRKITCTNVIPNWRYSLSWTSHCWTCKCCVFLISLSRHFYIHNQRPKSSHTHLQTVWIETAQNLRNHHNDVRMYWCPLYIELNALVSFQEFPSHFQFYENRQRRKRASFYSVTFHFWFPFLFFPIWFDEL